MSTPSEQQVSYVGLYRRNKLQPFSDVFAFFPKQGNDWDAAFRQLAALARQGESWESPDPKFPCGNVEILKNYLNYTFLRLQEERKILYSTDNHRACFNTGLQTKYGKDIVASFFANSIVDDKMTPWVFHDFSDLDQTDFRGYESTRPAVAEYYTNVSDLFFDLDYDLKWNTVHIVEENIARLPKELQSNTHLASLAIEGALSGLKGRIKRNYKLAVPHWYHNHIQLLLPLCLTDDNEVSLALVADKDEAQKCYRITTILSREMAYVDARLICRPDSEWLRI